MRKGQILCGLVLLLLGFFVSFARMAGASEETQLKTAPLSPAFLAYRERSVGERGEASSLLSSNAEERGGGYVPPPVDLSHLRSADYSAYFTAKGRRAVLPVSYDLRNENAVTPVRNQAPYGACWAFSALGSMESIYLRSRGVTLDLSPMHLAYYAYKDEAGFDTQGISETLNVGGNDVKATAVLARWVGPVLERDVPYGVTPSGPYDRYAGRLHLQDAYFTGGMNVPEDQSQQANDIRKELIMSHGGISLAYYWSSVSTAYNEAKAAWYSPIARSADHAVLAVGWDDRYSRENFSESARPERDGAWLIKNSRGPEWGQDGYFWLSYEEKSITDGVAYLPEETANYDNLYDYDALGLCRATGYGTRIAWMANVFTARGSETLKAVSFYTLDVGASYEISVYTALKDAGDPTSGARAFAPQKGSEVFAGYHTVELDVPVSLPRGTTFSVVVKMTAPSYTYPIAVERAVLAYSKNAVIGRGESFFSQDGARWEDGVNGTGNACLKAFTVNASASAPEPAPSGGGGGGGGCGTMSGGALALAPLLLRRKLKSR